MLTRDSPFVLERVESSSTVLLWGIPCFFLFFLWIQGLYHGERPRVDLVFTRGCDTSLVSVMGSDPRTELDDHFHITALQGRPNRELNPGPRRCKAPALATVLLDMKGASGFIIQRREDRNAIEKRRRKQPKSFFFFLMSHVRIELWTSSSMVLNSTIYTDGLDDSRFEHDYLNSKNMFYRSGVRFPCRASFFFFPLLPFPCSLFFCFFLFKLYIPVLYIFQMLIYVVIVVLIFIS